MKVLSQIQSAPDTSGEYADFIVQCEEISNLNRGIY